MKKNKLELVELKIKSFITDVGNKNELKGGINEHFPYERKNLKITVDDSEFGGDANSMIYTVSVVSCA